MTKIAFPIFALCICVLNAQIPASPLNIPSVRSENSIAPPQQDLATNQLSDRANQSVEAAKKLQTVNLNKEFDVLNEQSIGLTIFSCNESYCYPTSCIGGYTNQQYLQTFEASCENCQLGLSFSRFATSQFDELTIYDGNSIQAPVIGTFSGNKLPKTIIASGKEITLYFAPNLPNGGTGWELTTLCIPRPLTPTNIVIDELQSSQAMIHWKSKGDETGFEIDLSTSPTFSDYETFKIESNNVNDFLFNDLDSVTTYYTRLRSLKNEGYSFYSPTYTFKTLGKPFISKPLSSMAIPFTDIRIKMADFDGDKLYDFLAYNISDKLARIYRNTGNEKYELTKDYKPDNESPTELAWVDIDNDNDLDVISNEFEKIKVLVNTDNKFEPQLLGIPNFVPSGLLMEDYDKDGDIDIFSYQKSISLAAWYKNNGNLEFSFDSLNYLNKAFESVQLADLNNDRYPDLIVDEGGNGSQFYINNQGNGYQHTLYPGISGENYKFVPADVDNDGDNDLIVNNYYSIMIAINDGTGLIPTYTYVTGGALQKEGIAGDLDNDGDIDVVFGTDSDEGGTIYINKGNYKFAPIKNFSFEDTGTRIIELVDWDNDSDLDIIAESGSAFPATLRLNKTKNINKAPSVPTLLTSVVNKDNVHFDWQRSTDTKTASTAIRYNYFIGISENDETIRNSQSCRDNGQQKLFTFELSSLNHIDISGLQNGNYFFGIQAIDASLKASTFAISSFKINSSEVILPPEELKVATYSPYQNILTWQDKSANEDAFCILRSEDYTGGYKKIATLPAGITTYNDANLLPFTGYFYRVVAIKNNGESSYMSPIVQCQTLDIFSTRYQFDDSPDIKIPTDGEMAWIDFDNDNKRDLSLFGATYQSSYPYNREQIFQTYTQRQDNPWSFDPLEITIDDPSDMSPLYNSIDWGDIDNDGDFDFVAARTVWRVPNLHITIMINKGDFNFEPVLIDEFEASNFTSVRLGDFDNDGDLDVLASSRDYRCNVTNVYKNNGNAVFSLFMNLKFGGNAEWIDYNNDGLLDFVMTAHSGINGDVSYFYAYRNNGTTFIQTDKFEKAATKIAIADANNDGYDDILLTSFNNNNGYLAYDKDADKFIVTDIGLKNSQAASYGTWVDYDNDHLTDLIRTEDPLWSFLSLYKNNGGSKFEFKKQVGDLSSPNYAVNDIDQDSDMDVIAFGGNPANVRILENNGKVIKEKPKNPISLSQIAAGDSLTLNWISGDINPNLTFNVMLGTGPDKSDIINPMSDLVTGFHKINQAGNARHTPFKILKGLKNGVYFWNVQALDENIQASPFSTSNSFTIGTPFLPTPDIINAIAISSKKIHLKFPEYNNIQAKKLLYFSENGVQFHFLDSVQVNKNEYDHQKLKPNQTYYYRILLYDDVNYSEYSKIVNATTFALPQITGQVDLKTFEDQPLSLQFSDVSVINAPAYPTDYKILIKDGDNYDVAGSLNIQPDANFTGILIVPVNIANLVDTSDVFLLYIKVIPITAVQENINKNLLLYPNPANDFIIISNGKGSDQINCSIIDSKGITISLISIDKKHNDLIIDVSELSSGIYLLRMLIKHETKFLRFVKK